MLGSIICQRCHFRLTQLGLATARDERPGWPLQKLWPGIQRRQVTHNDIPARRIMGGDVGGGHGAEVHGVGILVPSETPNADTMTGVWSLYYRGLHDGTPLPHARDLTCSILESATNQPDSTPTPGILCELPADDEVMPLPIPRIPGVLPHVKCLALPLQQAALGVRLRILE